MSAQITVNMEKRGNVYYIPGKVNGLPLQFIFDTGASNVYISLTEALFMMKNGYLLENDFGDNAYTQVADGSFVENTEVTLREIDIAGIKLHNIKAYVSNTLNSPLLFGQSAIQKLGPIQLEGNRLTICNATAQHSEERAVSLYQRAFQECEAGNFDKAIQLSEQALAASANRQLRAVLYDNIAWAYSNSNRKPQAIEALIAALGEDMMCAQAAYNLGVNYFETGQTDKALRALNMFIERHSDTQNKNMLAAAYSYKGDCHRINGEIVEAENAYRHSLDLVPSSQSLLGLADLYFSAQRYGEAIPFFTSALEYEPNRLSNIKRYCQLGYCYLEVNNVTEALPAFHSCISALAANREMLDWAVGSGDEQSMKSATEFLYYGYLSQLNVARYSSDISEIISNYEIVLSLPATKTPIQCEDFLKWESAILANGETPHSIAKALEVLNKGLEVFPDNPDLLFAYSLHEDCSSQEYLERLSRILDTENSYNPLSFDYATVYNNIAWHYALNRNYVRALPYAQTSIRLNSEHLYTWDTLGEIYYNLGRYEDCIEAYSHCLNSDDTEQIRRARTFRGNSYLELGKNREGRRELNLANQTR